MPDVKGGLARLPVKLDMDEYRCLIENVGCDYLFMH